MTQVFSPAGSLIPQDKMSLIKSGLKKLGIIALVFALDQLLRPIIPDLSSWLSDHNITVGSATILLALDWVIKLIQKKYGTATYVAPNQNESL